MIGLMDQVAAHLTGRAVTVRPRKSAYIGARGTFYPMPNGRGLIDLDTDLDQERAYRIFLHECAHAKLDYHPVTSEAAARRPPESVELDLAAVKSAAHQERESRLWDQADAWDDWAAANLDRVNKPTGDWVLDRLQALRTLEVYRR